MCLTVLTVIYYVNYTNTIFFYMMDTLPEINKNKELWRYVSNNMRNIIFCKSLHHTLYLLRTAKMKQTHNKMFYIQMFKTLSVPKGIWVIKSTQLSATHRGSVYIGDSLNRWVVVKTEFSFVCVNVRHLEHFT